MIIKSMSNFHPFCHDSPLNHIFSFSYHWIQFPGLESPERCSGQITLQNTSIKWAYLQKCKVCCENIMVLHEMANNNCIVRCFLEDSSYVTSLRPVWYSYLYSMQPSETTGLSSKCSIRCHKVIQREDMPKTLLMCSTSPLLPPTTTTRKNCCDWKQTKLGNTPRRYCSLSCIPAVKSQTVVMRILVSAETA